jgi:hypothetical protein
MAIGDTYPRSDSPETLQTESIQAALLTVMDMQQADLDGGSIDYTALDTQVSSLAATFEAIRQNRGVLAIIAPNGVPGFTVTNAGSSSPEEVRRFRTISMPNLTEKGGRVCWRFMSSEKETSNSGHIKAKPSITLTREQLETCEFEIITP